MQIATNFELLIVIKKRKIHEIFNEKMKKFKTISPSCAMPISNLFIVNP